MRESQIGEVVEVCLFKDFHRYLATSINATNDSVCRCCFNREIAAFVQARYFLPVDIVELISLIYHRYDITWLVNGVAGTGHRTKIRLRETNRRYIVLPQAKNHQLSDVFQVADVFE